MTLPIERYKNSYSNWRANPWTLESLAVDKIEDNLYIPSSSPYQIQLLELPRKDVPSSVTVYCYDTVGYFTEVAYPPAQSQFSVDYPPADGKGTGLIVFNQNDANKQVKVSYKATGSPVLEEFLNTKVSWPAGTPTDRQIPAFLSSLNNFAWRNNPVRYFSEGNVVYNASGEDESSMVFRFKKASTEGKVLLELKGAKLHQAYYSELKQHLHAAGSLSQPTHQHGAGTLAGSQPTHTHLNRGNIGDSLLQSDPAGNDAVSISGQVAAGGADDITGNTANTGVTAKTYPNAFKVWVDGVDKTSQILAKCGLGALGNGTAGHAFVTGGTGEMDISDLITSDGFHEIRVTEPQNAGGRCLLHLEVY